MKYKGLIKTKSGYNDEIPNTVSKICRVLFKVSIGLGVLCFFLSTFNHNFEYALENTLSTLCICWASGFSMLIISEVLNFLHDILERLNEFEIEIKEDNGEKDKDKDRLRWPD